MKETVLSAVPEFRNLIIIDARLSAITAALETDRRRSELGLGSDREMPDRHEMDIRTTL